LWLNKRSQKLVKIQLKQKYRRNLPKHKKVDVHVKIQELPIL
jgi:hypothetical protein